METDKKTILVVEDELGIRELLKFILEKAGYRVLVADDGLKAVICIQEKSPDMILLDVMLPGIDGIEVCRQVRSDPEVAHIPILMLTAKDTPASLETGLKQGADDYMIKPFEPEKVKSRVAALFKRCSRGRLL